MAPSEEVERSADSTLQIWRSLNGGQSWTNLYNFSYVNIGARR
jgi:hypothetical protein